MEATATSALAVPASKRTSPELTNRCPLVFFLPPSKPSTCTTFDVATGSWAATLAVGHASKHPATSRIRCKGLVIGVSPDEWLRLVIPVQRSAATGAGNYIPRSGQWKALTLMKRGHQTPGSGGAGRPARQGKESQFKGGFRPLWSAFRGGYSGALSFQTGVGGKCRCGATGIGIAATGSTVRRRRSARTKPKRTEESIESVRGLQ